MRLTEFSSCGGCAAKLPVGTLAPILRQMQSVNHPDLLVGIEHFDDAAVYKINEENSLVQTVDFFPAIVDDPKAFGRIAAANALSDVYAMGGQPLTAMCIATFPEGLLSANDFLDILKGGEEKIMEAGATLVGGHTLKEKIVIYGLSVTGIVKNSEIITNSGAKEGDCLVLTKPIGTGVYINALKSGAIQGKEFEEALELMTALNDYPVEPMKKHEATACTDVTGFSLLGHALEIAKASNVTIKIDSGKVPFIRNVKRLSNEGHVPSSTIRNSSHFSPEITQDNNIDEAIMNILFDPQTNGGLLISCPKEEGSNLVKTINRDSSIKSAVIGEVTKKRNTCLTIS